MAVFIHGSDEHKGRPVEGMLIAALRLAQLPLNLTQRSSLVLFVQALIEIYHELKGGAVVDLPLAGKNRLRAGQQERPEHRRNNHWPGPFRRRSGSPGLPED